LFAIHTVQELNKGKIDNTVLHWEVKTNGFVPQRNPLTVEQFHKVPVHTIWEQHQIVSSAVFAPAWVRRNG